MADARSRWRRTVRARKCFSSLASVNIARASHESTPRSAFACVRTLERSMRGVSGRPTGRRKTTVRSLTGLQVLGAKRECRRRLPTIRHPRAARGDADGPDSSVLSAPAHIGQERPRPSAAQVTGPRCRSASHCSRGAMDALGAGVLCGPSSALTGPRAQRFGAGDESAWSANARLSADSSTRART
jgi:hypothetical protein